MKNMKNIVSLLLSIFSGVFSAQPVYLHFIDSAVVSDRVICLEDIARITTPANEKVDQGLEKAEIGDAAPAGFSRYINVADIIQFSLRSRYDDIHFQASGAKRVKVRTEGVKKTVDEYESRILEYLNENIGWDKGCYKVTLENREKQWYCYPGHSVVEVKGLASPYPRGNTRLKLVITQGKTEFTVPVLCKIKVEVPVVIASESIKRDDIIDAGKLELSIMDITAFRYTPYTDISSVTGNIAVKTLSPGTILHKRCIKPVPDVCKGDKVFIILEKGAVRLSVPARAREEGVKGDRIWVENLNSHKLIRVQITGKGIVHLNQGESI